MSLSKVIEVAESQLGVTEYPPGSNKVIYNTDYYGKEVSGADYPWCCTYLWWVFNKAGEGKAFFNSGKTASCNILLRWYKEQGLTVPVDQVRAGDIVLLNFHGGQTPEHCGLVECVMHSDDGVETIWTIEGNTTPGEEGSQDNGGCVALKDRYPRQIVAVCRPQYKEKDMDKKDDITGHWAEKDIRRCLEKGIMKGYPDGSFQPDKPVTRAELAVILDRLGLLR